MCRVLGLVGSDHLVRALCASKRYRVHLYTGTRAIAVVPFPCVEACTLVDFLFYVAAFVCSVRARAGWYVILGLILLFAMLPISGVLSKKMMVATIAKLRTGDERTRVGNGAYPS